MQYKQKCQPKATYVKIKQCIWIEIYLFAYITFMFIIPRKDYAPAY